MVKALFDTNVLIDYLNAVPQARDELTRYGEKAISIITWMEVLVGAKPEWQSERALSWRALQSSLSTTP
ncbi:PIN domain-containing protein [Rhizobium sp. BR 362]